MGWEGDMFSGRDTSVGVGWNRIGAMRVKCQDSCGYI